MVRTVSAAAAVSLALAAYGSVPSPERQAAASSAPPVLGARLRPAPTAPKVLRRAASTAPVKIRGTGPLFYQAEGPSPLRLRDLRRPQASRTAAAPTQESFVRGGPRPKSLFSDAQVEMAKARARTQAPASRVQDARRPLPTAPAIPGPTLVDSWDAIDAGDCCEGVGYAATVPPDPDIAVGRSHVIAVVNTSFEIYDKQGNVLVPAVQFSTFFDGTPGCTTFDGGFGATFDPDVVYDEIANRYVIGIDGNGTDYCIAATRTGDPTGTWFRYGFPTNVNGAFFDFPHMGVGEQAVFVGSNQFGGTLLAGFEGRVFAADKAALYAGRALRVASREVKPDGQPTFRLDGTPQPAQFQPRLRGRAKPGPHYIMTEYFDGKSHSVYAWTDPFGANTFDLVGDVDLAAASGVPCPSFSCFPVEWPQSGSVQILAGNDYRGQETKYRNGFLWTAQTISCNPGAGTVNCIRWAQIDPRRVTPGDLNLTTGALTSSTLGVKQAGVYGADGEFRTFPSLAADKCDNMAIGYSVGSASMFPSILVSGRRRGDAPGTLRPEVQLKAGEVPYTSFQDNANGDPERWGDYSGMAIDPDGRTFWYIGEYSRDNSTANPQAGWGTYIGAFRLGCIPGR